MLLAGCARFSSVQTEDTNGIRKTEIRASTLFDANSELAKLRASTTDKSQTVTIGSLNQESTSTNLVNLLLGLAQLGALLGKATVVAAPAPGQPLPPGAVLVVPQTSP
jgi:hypothetical protein